MKERREIAIVLDEKAPRERLHALQSKINSIRHDCTVQTFRGDTSDEVLFELLQKKKYDLILAPWYRYVTWKKLEILLGSTRVSGTTLGGYFSQPVKRAELLSLRPDLNRVLLLDFVDLSNGELRRVVNSLSNEKHRLGIRSLLDGGSTIYTDTWTTHFEIGERMGEILSIPEFENSGWGNRATEIRIAMIALWNLVYREGPGKGAFYEASSLSQAKAFFQLGMDSSCLAFRLFFATSGWRAKDSIISYWPTEEPQFEGISLLAQYSDFLKVHTIAENNKIEIVACFFQSAPSRKKHDHVNGIWIEPITEKLLFDRPDTAVGPKAPYLKHLRDAQVTTDKKGDASPAAPRNDLVHRAYAQVHDLKALLNQKESFIKELKQGGVGTNFKPQKMDGDTLLDQFRTKFQATRHTIRQMELELSLLYQRQASDLEIQALRNRLKELIVMEQNWVLELQNILNSGNTGKEKKG